MRDPNRILLLGPPAGGKGTQCKLMAQYFELACLGTGNLLRREVDSGSALGLEVDGYLSRGAYVPDELILEMVKAWLDKHPKGWLLDGFPRTLPQAQALDKIAQPDVVVALDVSQELLEQRIAGRLECTSCGHTFSAKKVEGSVCPDCAGTLAPRTDDGLENFRRRYANYSELTLPLFDYYQSAGKLVRIDGSQAPEAVFASILESINALQTHG